MDIKITCRNCSRHFPLSMIVDPDGRQGYCPFCGEALAFQYTGTLIETAERLLAAAPQFVRELILLAELAGGFEIDGESVLEPLRAALDIQKSAIAEPYRPGWPPAKAEPVK